MKTIAMLALLVLTSAAQANTKSLLSKHNANNITELLQQTVHTGALSEIRQAIKIASDYNFESEQFYTISQLHYDYLSHGLLSGFLPGVGLYHNNEEEPISFLKELAAKANKIDGEDKFRINGHDFNLAQTSASLKTYQKPKARAVIEELADWFISNASNFGGGIASGNFDGVMMHVAINGDPEVIDLFVELADAKQHPFLRFQTFGSMIFKAAQYGKNKAIDRIIEHADRYAPNIEDGNFTTAIKFAAGEKRIETMRHVFTIATKRGVRFTADDFGSEILADAMDSGDPKTIALVLELAAEYGVTIEHKYFAEALRRAARSYSGMSKLELVVDFAAEQGVKLNIDDFSSAMAVAARYNNIKEVRKVLKLAAEHGFIFRQKHFVAAMQAAARGGNYKALSRINKIANKHGVKLSKDSLSHLLPYVAELFLFVTPSQQLVDKTVDAIIKLTTSLEFEVDAEYFEAAISYAKRKEFNFKVVEELQKIAADHGVRLSDQAVKNL